MKLRSIILFVFFNLLVCPIFGQGSANFKNLKFKHLSVKEGLSQSSVMCVFQDHKGFLWFGTRDGLNRYDGYTFKNYRYNSQDSGSLSNNYIRVIYEDENNNLWIGTDNGLNKYISDQESFIRYSPTAIDKKEKESDKGIWTIATYNKDCLLVGTNFGLKTFNTKSGLFEQCYIVTPKKTDSSVNHVMSLLKTQDGDFWICSNMGMDFYSPKRNIKIHYFYAQNGTKNIAVDFSTIYQDREKNLWLGYKGGLALFNKKKNVFEQFVIHSGDILNITDEVRTIEQDYLGNFWVGTYNGLYIINSDKSAITHIRHDENDSNSLSQNSIYKIFEDSKGDIWIGSYYGGIDFYDRSYDVFKNFSSGTNNTKLNYKVVSSIIEDGSQNLWIGTEGGGINFLNRKTGLFSYYKHNENDSNSLSADNVKSMIQTRGGNFWIGTHDGGLNFLNPNQRPFQFKKYKKIAGDNNSLSNNRVISLFEDYKNNIWIGTDGGGINVLDPVSKAIQRIPDPSEAIGYMVYSITKTSNKNIILIAGNKGLAKVNCITHKIMPVPYKIKKNLYNTNNTAYAYEDASKNIWIATGGNGLYHYNTVSKKSTKYGIAEGLPNEVVSGVLEDDYNNLWITSNFGISRFNLKSHQFKNFDISDGLLGNEFNDGSFLKLKNGDLMFGGVNGINFFNPNNIVENAYTPPVYITSVFVNNKPFLEKDTAENRIELDYDQNDFSFNFVALSYSQSNKNQYAYKLEGFDKDWHYIGNKKSATYTNIDAGNYVFKIKASNNDGLWNEKGDAIDVKIYPAPWRSWWAYLIYLILITASIYNFRKYSLLRIHEKNELRRERLEKEKMAEINQMKLQLFTNISHDFRTPLTLIMGPLERMIAKKAGDAAIQEQHENMHRNASVLLQLVNQLLDFRKSESGKLKIKASKNNIVPFVENIKLSFDELAKAKEINYTFHAASQDIEVWFDTINLKKVIYNLLSNAFKFTPNSGEIAISVSTVIEKDKKGKLTDFLELVIRDNGKGIPEKKHKFIFDLFYQLDDEENARLGTGIGLALTKNIVKLHKGIIKAVSNEGEGTSFIVLLPLGIKHLNDSQIVYGSDNAIDDESSYYVGKPDYLSNTPVNEIVEEEVNTDKSRPTLLLVEDNNELRAFIKSIFSDYTIYEAENGQEGLDIANENVIDLIISDVMMPVMNGIELCAKIKTNILTSHIPVILLTAKTSEESQKSGYTTGADAYITKPFDAEILEIRVKNIIRSRKFLIQKFKKEAILEPKELAATSADELFLQKAIDLIEKNIYNSEYSIDDFISEMSMSRSVLYRKLKALTDQSITEFIRTIKLKRAGQLILKSQSSISEIAFDLGFNDLKYFRTCFQKLFNELPSQYRAKHSENLKDNMENDLNEDV
ncbi:hybrid sensor histidine kinase/response regulator transcription factor [Flavobacterium sp. WC2509]|uniref:hybrid sensor histidine kinase/response regulator transcription factor n=1 Tax=Flavobacterium sp. WC2509 TaxID=3461406 RepID=UPI0040445A0D